MSDRFENDLEITLKAAAVRVDQGTRDELARRRRQTLDAIEPGSSRRPLWLPLGGVAAALLAVLLVQPFSRDQMPEPAVADTGDIDIDIEILLAEENLDLYEDLEFYDWLDAVGDAS